MNGIWEKNRELQVWAPHHVKTPCRSHDKCGSRQRLKKGLSKRATQSTAKACDASGDGKNMRGTHEPSCLTRNSIHKRNVSENITRRRMGPRPRRPRTVAFHPLRTVYIFFPLTTQKRNKSTTERNTCERHDRLMKEYSRQDRKYFPPMLNTRTTLMIVTVFFFFFSLSKPASHTDPFPRGKR